MPIEIHGRQYATVAERLKVFNERYPYSSIETEITYPDVDTVRCRAKIWPDVEQILRMFTGHAEENRKASRINQTSAVENCETSAIGRALAAMGICIDSGIASADEIESAKRKETVLTDENAKAEIAKLLEAVGKAPPSGSSKAAWGAAIKDTVGIELNEDNSLFILNKLKEMYAK